MVWETTGWLDVLPTGRGPVSCYCFLTADVSQGHLTSRRNVTIKAGIRGAAVKAL